MINSHVLITNRPSIRLLNLLFAALLTAVFGIGHAFAACNNSNANIRINVNQMPVNLSQIDSFNGRLNGWTSSAAYRAGYSRVAGFTSVDLDYNVSVAGNEYADGCFHINSVNVNLTNRDGIHVLIGAWHPPGTCEYKVILQHEMTHVKIFRDTQSQFQKLFRAEVARAVAAVDNEQPGSFFARSSYERAIDQAVENTHKQMLTRIKQLNAALDHRASDGHEQARCPHWRTQMVAASGPSKRLDRFVMSPPGEPGL